MSNSCKVIPQLDGNQSLNSSISIDSECQDFESFRIDTVVSFDRPKKENDYRFVNKDNLVTIKRNNKILDAAQLPVVINLNPRSIYNKAEEFKTMMDQLDCTLCFISETWDRNDIEIENIIDMENFRIIKNVCQRGGRGGKPALVISTKHFYYKELSPSPITVPIGLEAVWALLTPKTGGQWSKVRHIVVCSYYFTDYTKRNQFIDHIAESIATLSSIYGDGLHFILAGDSNKLNLKPILNLSPELKQVVQVPTRKNPDAILDTIITTLSDFYLPPCTLPPLQNDEAMAGAPSDHLIVYMKPISSIDPKLKETKKVKFRPLPESGLAEFGTWLRSQTWESVFSAETAHEKAENMQKLIMYGVDKYLPEKCVKVSSDDQPWYNDRLKRLARKIKREYFKHKKSDKWVSMRTEYLRKCDIAKASYYENIVKDLKVSRPSQWYSKLKRMSSQNQSKSDNPVVLSIKDLPNQTQAEIIADEFCTISNMYFPLEKDDITEKSTNNLPFPNMTPYFVHQQIKKIKTGSATIKGDIPAKIIKMFGYELSFPLSNIFIRCCTAGEYPDIWKTEVVTPVPKKYPPEKPNQLRKISGTLNFSKIFEKFLADAIVKDMAPNSDKSQFGNRKGVSTQHYLIKLLHRVLTSLDKKTKHEANAVILHLIDWKQAFDRQCPKLGVQSFIRNGVRNSLIPVLTNYFQNRKMQVKWNGTLSSLRAMPGGGPQGCHMGQLEYLSQSDDSGNFVLSDDRFKFIDDMSLLDIINLLACGLSEYDFIHHVASDIPIGGKYLDSQNCNSQEILNSVAEWTNKNKMKLNEDKTNFMIFNPTRNSQFGIRLHLNGKPLEMIKQTTLLGTVISSDLTWTSNTSYIIKKAYQRLEILKKLYSFHIPIQDLVQIYTLYVRSILEFNCCVWHYNITLEERNDIERVQKVACKIMLKKDYTSYAQALKKLGLQTLDDRRHKLCEKFAKNCVKGPLQVSEMFPRDLTRHSNKYQVTFARNERLLQSAIPQMQRLLNRS